MDTRTRGKVIAQVAGAGLIAASTLGAAALALETYQDVITSKPKTLQLQELMRPRALAG